MKAARASARQGLDLLRIQRSFFAAVTSRGGKSNFPHPSMESMIVGDARLDAAGRIAIYRRMYWDRLLDDVLRVDFPKTQQVLGDSQFSRLARAYLQLCPPRDPQIGLVSAAFPAFLAKHAPAQVRRWIGALAGLEWARIDLVDRADQRPLTLDEIRMLSPARLSRLRLRPLAAHALLPSSADIAELWTRLEYAKVPPRLPRPLRRPVKIVVWRPELVVRHRAISKVEWPLFQLFLSGTTLAELCAALVAGNPKVPPAATAARAFQVVGAWIAEGLVAQPGSRKKGPIP